MAADVLGPKGPQLLQRLDRAGSRVEEVRIVLDRANRVIARPIHGQDGEGAVELVLGADGSIDAVHLDPDWRELVGEHGVSSAAAEAYRAAHGSRLSDWMGVIRENLGASGQVPLGIRHDRADSEMLREETGPDPDLSTISPEGPDAAVAAELLAALDGASAAALASPGVVSDPAVTSGAQVRRKVGEAFTGISAAIVRAPRWLNVTLVTSGAQHMVGTLRGITEELLDTLWDETRDPERSTGEHGDGAAADGALVRALEAAAARARLLLTIPEGLGMVAAAVEEFVAHLRACVESAGDSQHARVG